MDLVYQYSQGIPRLINLLCEHALITSFAEDQKSVSARTIMAVAREFELDAVPARSRRRPHGVRVSGAGGEVRSRNGEALNS